MSRQVFSVFVAQPSANVWLPKLKHSADVINWTGQIQAVFLCFSSLTPPWSLLLPVYVCRHQWVFEPWHLQSDLHQPEGRIQVWMSQRLPDGSDHRSLQGCRLVNGRDYSTTPRNITSPLNLKDALSSTITVIFFPFCLRLIHLVYAQDNSKWTRIV